MIEFVPNKKFVWVTTQSRRSTDNLDWTGTKMIFELNAKGENTFVTFTYDGVVIESEQDRLKEICDFCIKNLLYNFIESFTTTIEVAKPPQEVFNCITEIINWWSKDFEGSSKQQNDEFTIHHPGQHYSKQKLIEAIPDKKIVWLVTDSTLYWLQNNKHEWTNTKMIFEIITAGLKQFFTSLMKGLSLKRNVTPCVKKDGV